MRFGNWRACPFPRDTLILAFPRAVGGVARPLWASLNETHWGEGYTLNAEGTARALPALGGSFVYVGGVSPGEHGQLCMVWKGFSPSSEKGTYLSADSDVQCVAVAELYRSYSHQSKGKGKMGDRAGGDPVSLFSTPSRHSVCWRACPAWARSWAPASTCPPRLVAAREGCSSGIAKLRALVALAMLACPAAVAAGGAALATE